MSSPLVIPPSGGFGFLDSEGQDIFQELFLILGEYDRVIDAGIDGLEIHEHHVVACLAQQCRKTRTVIASEVDLAYLCDVLACDRFPYGGADTNLQTSPWRLFSEQVRFCRSGRVSPEDRQVKSRMPTCVSPEDKQVRAFGVHRAGG